MSFFAKFFRKHGRHAKKAHNKQLDRNMPAPSKADTLTELRHQARTGDPKLDGKHHSGSF